MDANGNPVGDANYDICESALGRRASHGCVRVQRQANADGYSHTWLWNNLRGQKNVKIIIWDDDGRKLTETDASTPMYYNKNGGKKYHTNGALFERQEQVSAAVGHHLRRFEQLSVHPAFPVYHVRRAGEAGGCFRVEQRD